MKKFIALMLILSLALSMTGCGGSKAPAPSAAPAPTASSAPAEAPSAAAQPESSSEPFPTFDAQQSSDPADFGGYGGPGEDYVEEVPPYTLSFTDEESIFPYEIRTITTDEGFSGEFAVYTIPAKTEIAAEIFADKVLVNLVRLHDHPDGIYSVEGMGCLNGDNSWTPAPHLTSAGDRFVFSLDEAGLWEVMVIDGEGNFNFFFFEVTA